MQNLFYWNGWKTPEKILFWFFFLLLFSVTVWYCVGYAVGFEAMVSWTTEAELQDQKIRLDSFREFFFDFDYEADGYLFTEKYKATEFTLSAIPHYIYLIVFTLAFVLFLTASVYLSQTYYFVAVGMAVFYMVMGNWELLGVGGRTDKTVLISMLVVYLPLSYYFHEFDTKFSFIARFAIFSLLTAVFGFVIFQFSEVKNPIFFLSVSPLAMPVLLGAGFCILIGHEIVHAILYFISDKANTGKNTPMHFGVLSAVYLVNVFYAYLVNIRAVDWGLLYIDPLLLLILSVFLGLWALPRRRIQFGNIIDLQPHGTFLYVSIAIMSLSTAALGFATANDPLIEVFEDLAAFSHFGYGTAFLIYALVNFADYLGENKKVHLVVYQPYRVEFVWVIVAGSIFVGMMFFRANFITYKQTYAAYFNGLGDTYRQENDKFLSEQYYKSALYYDFQNHRSNYALATLAREQGDKSMAYYYFDRALAKSPTPYAYAESAELLLQNDRFIDALFRLRDGIKKFPRNGELYNNLGLLYSKTNVFDSAYYYFDKARNFAKKPEIPEANLYQIWTRYKANPDSVQHMASPEKYVAVSSNNLLLFNHLAKEKGSSLQTEFLADSTLQTIQLCYLYHYALNQRTPKDTTFLTFLNKYTQVPENVDFREFLEMAQAVSYYRLGQYQKTAQLLDKINVSGNPANPQYAYMAGTFAFQFGQYRQAADYFRKAYFKGYKPARLRQAVALSEINQAEAVLIWLELAQEKDSTYRIIAKDMLKVLHPDSLKTIDIAKLDEASRYQLLHYQQNSLKDADFENLANTLQNPSWKLRAYTERIDFFVRNKQRAEATALREKIADLKGDLEKRTLQYLNSTDLALLFETQNWKVLEQKLQNPDIEPIRKGYATLYSAVLAQNAQDTTKAKQLFRQATVELPYEAQTHILLAGFYKKQNRPMEAYGVLLAGLKLYNDHHTFPPELLKVYILEALDNQLDSFAEHGFSQLADLVSPEELKAFEVEYNKHKTVVEE